MISTRLKSIFALSIPVFVAHGIEEYLTGFYNIDRLDQIIFSPLVSMSVHQATFATFQIMLWLILIVSFLLILGEQWQLRLMTVLGFIYVFELHHIYKAIMAGGYYPGVVTALLFPIIGYFFWKELIKNYKLSN